MRFVEQFYLIIHVFILVKRNKMFLQGKKKTPSASTKGFWFVSADIPLKALCFPLKCRALGHETLIPGDCRYGATQLLYCLTSYVLNFKSEL